MCVVNHKSTIISLLVYGTIYIYIQLILWHIIQLWHIMAGNANEKSDYNCFFLWDYTYLYIYRDS